jgi:oligosaccharyltransferase complex subunit delta (ribophorin II)
MLSIRKSIVLCILAVLFVSISAEDVEVVLATKSFTLGSSEVAKVLVKDASGKPVPSKVVITKAYPSNSDSTVLISNKEMALVDGAHQFDLSGSKMEAGSYTLELKITPNDKKFSPLESSLSISAVGPVTISETVVVVSESEDSQDLASGKKHKVDAGKKIDGVVKAGQSQHLFVDFKVKGQSGKVVQVQQAFVRLTNAAGRELIQPAKFTASKGYTAHFPVREVASEFYGQSGSYELSLIVADAFVANPTNWVLGSVSFTFSNTSRADPPADPFAKQAEIKHAFRVPDKRPPKTISLAFTAAALGVPALVLFIGLLRVGANVSNFPTGANFIFAVGFQGCLAAILALFVLYWLRLNMVQTLTYFGVLAIPSLFFAHRNLNGLSKAKQHTD